MARLNGIQIAGLLSAAAGLLYDLADDPASGRGGRGRYGGGWAIWGGAALFAYGSWRQHKDTTAELGPGGPVASASMCALRNDHEFCLYQDAGNPELYWYTIDGAEPVFGGTWAQAKAAAEAHIRALPDW